MADSAVYKGGRGNIGGDHVELNLDTLDDTTESYARVIKAYNEGRISENKGRALTYMFSGYLNYWKMKKDLQIEARLDEIEDLLKERKHSGV